MIYFTSVVFVALGILSLLVDGSDLKSAGVLASASYQASIQWNGAHRCSGAIISNQFVVTTASCFVQAPKRPTLVTVCVGSQFRDLCEQYPIDLIITHKEFSYRRPKKRYDNRENVTKPYEKPNPIYTPYDTLRNDVALLHLRYNMTLSKEVTPIKLKSNFDKRDDHQITLLTWTIVYAHKDLRGVHMQSFNRTCFGSRAKLCLVPKEEVFNKYDPGAPIVYDNELIALHSKTVTNKQYKAVSIGTLIPSYYDWIIDNHERYQPYTETLENFGRRLVFLDQIAAKARKTFPKAEESNDGTVAAYRNNRLLSSSP